MTDDQKEMDCSYHCKYASRIPILAMDPSVAVVCIYNLDFDCIISRNMRNFEEEVVTLHAVFNN